MYRDVNPGVTFYMNAYEDCNVNADADVICNVNDDFNYVVNADVNANGEYEY